MLIQNSTVFVTGADGFIGSHLTEALVRHGCRVKAMVLYNSFGFRGWLEDLPRDVAEQVEIVAGDVRDPHAVRELMKGCDVVFHLAALIAIPYSYLSPDSYVDTNVRGTLNVLQAARDLEVARVVHTSTSEVYGTALRVPIDESHPLQGQSPYSASKIGADQLALSFYRSFGTPVSLIRPFNTYGPRQSARAVIPSIILQLAQGASQLHLGALHPTRDFSYVEDSAAGFIRLAECDAALGEVVNYGSGFEISIGDTVDLIAELMGANVEVISDEQRLRPAASEVERLWADITKARELTGHVPAHGGLEGFRQGIEKTIEWFREPHNLKRYRAESYGI
jgi:NAD dependent epimerase/dehydratase